MSDSPIVGRGPTIAVGVQDALWPQLVQLEFHEDGTVTWRTVDPQVVPENG